MNYSILKRKLSFHVGYSCAAILLLGSSLSVTSCKDELLTGMPVWLGSSIYEELEERGSFTQTLALINDPDLSEYPALLRKTGSMTLFVADDAAWGRYLAKRGVTSVTQLSKAEKKNLLKSAMINNAYLIDLLSNLPGDPPSEGTCMRRSTRVDVEDSITILKSTDYPAYNTNRVDEDGNVIDHWQNVRDKSSIKLINRYRQDGSLYDDSKPMVHFLPRFMTQNSITDNDISILTNGASNSINRSYINGYAVAKNDGRWSDRDVEQTGISKEFLQDITCQNGYIHILEEVPEQLGSMAEIIGSKSQFSIFSELLERFSYPQWVSEQEVNGTKEIYYTKRYLNSSLNHSLNSYVDKNGQTVTYSDVLSIDPGWNQYVLYTSGGRNSIAENEAAMFVPTDEQMNAYLQGEGRAIGVKYGTWDKVPDNLVAPFVNNCIQKSFVATTPSKFEAMKNTAAEPMTISASDISNCYMACNGVVYEVNNVFAAPEHESVLFPALLRADEDMSMSDMITKFDPTVSGTSSAVKSAWKLNEFKAYLNSMSSTYSFLLPSDQAYRYYIDPYSFTKGKKPAGFVFYTDPTSSQPVNATAYLLDENGNLTADKAPDQPSIATIANRLYDILDNAIIVHGERGSQAFHPEQTIYLTKAGSPVQVTFEGTQVKRIAGSMQLGNNTYTEIDPTTQVFDMTEKGNGVTYIMNALPQPTVISPDSMINDATNHPDYQSFAWLLNNSSFRSTSDELDGHKSIDHPISLFGNYHYSVYVPQKSAIDALIAAKKLPSAELWDEWEQFSSCLDDVDLPYSGTNLTPEQEAENEARQAEITALKTDATKKLDEMRTVINNFVRYHIQDGSVFLGGEQTTGTLYETAIVDTTTNRFHTINVVNNGNAITLTTNTNGTAHVISGKDSNQMTRQYLFDSSGNIFSSSFVVFHLIDNALSFDAKQFLSADFPTPEWPTWMPKPVVPDPGDDAANSPFIKKYRRR